MTTDAALTLAQLRHHGVVIATGPHAVAHIATAVAHQHPQPGAAVTFTLAQLREAVASNAPAVGFAGALIGEAIDLILEAVYSGQRVYVASEERFAQTRARFVGRARYLQYLDDRPSTLTGLWIVPLD